MWNFFVFKLSLVLLNWDLSIFENMVDSDQLASDLQIRIHTVFQSECKYMLTTRMLQVNEEECSTYKYSARQGLK